MGRSIALSLARNGCRVALAARTESQLLEVRAEIENEGGVAICFPGDISIEKHAISIVRETAAQLGRLDILVNNAGMPAGGPWETTSTEDWDRVVGLNARAPFILCREVIPYLQKQGGGFIFNILSIGGVLCYENYGTYSVSKNALRALTITLSKELRKDNIRVHAISMGAVDTPMLRMGLDFRPDIDPSKLIQPEEIADIVLFLLGWKGNGVIDEVNIRRPDASYWAAF